MPIFLSFPAGSRWVTMILRKAVFQDLGAEMNFWKLAIRPGQPLAFGKNSR